MSSRYFTKHTFWFWFFIVSGIIAAIADKSYAPLFMTVIAGFLLWLSTSLTQNK